MPSVVLADQLKRKGAGLVSLGIDYSRDINVFQYFRALDHIFNFVGRSGTSKIFDFNFDVVINQNWFTFDGGHTFYSQRQAILKDPLIQRPEFLLPDAQQSYAINKLLPSLGVRPFEYVVLHPQANYRSRTITGDSTSKAIQKITVPVVVIGQEIEVENCVNFTNQQSMVDCLLLLYYSRLFVGVCSCWSHFAWALWKDCFIFFSTTTEKNMWGDYHDRIKSVQCDDFHNGINVDDWGRFEAFLEQRGVKV